MKPAALAVLVAVALCVPVAEAAGGTVGAAAAPTRTIDAGGVTVGYRSIGTGRPLVLIQGLGGTIDAWDPTFLDALAAAGHRVIVFDNEGIGRSERRPGPLTIRRMADTTHRLIGALKLRRPDVVGWSMGGMTAQSLAVRHPRTIRRLVLLSSAPGDGRATPPMPAAGAVLTGDGLAAAALTLLFPPAATAARDRFVRHLARRRNPQLTLPPDLTRAQVVASGAWLGGQDPDGKRVRGLRLPVLVGGGALDPLLPVANQRRLARIIPGAASAIYADASHGFFLQRSRDFMPRLRRFLR